MANIQKSIRAFTLIELLVVIGLIAVLAGGLGLALSDKGNRASSLQNGQYTISSLLSGARARAALSQTSARLFVNSSPGSEGFLREFYIATQTGTPSTKWVVSGDPVLLPLGIYLVPLAPNGSKFPSSAVDLAPESGGAWPATSSSSAIDDSTGNETLQIVAGTDIAGVVYRQVQTLTTRGTTSGPGARIVLSGGEVINGTQIKFTKPEFVRGVNISSYGVASLINDVSGF